MSLENKLYIVVDTMGDGHVLGVFDDRELAEELVAIDPFYYKMTERALNEIDPDLIREIKPLDDG